MGGYPAYGYDTEGFAATNGTNACRYNFRDHNQVVIGSGYCVQWALGQRTGTGYDPLPWDGTIANDGYVRRVLADNWPAKDAPAVPSTNATVINRQRSGAVAMAIHYFTDGIVMPPNYERLDLRRGGQRGEPGAGRRAAAQLTDPRPTVDGPVSDSPRAGGSVHGRRERCRRRHRHRVRWGRRSATPRGPSPSPVEGPSRPAPSCGVRSATPGAVEIGASAIVSDPIGTLMVGDPTYRVQSMALATPLPLLGRRS